MRGIAAELFATGFEAAIFGRINPPPGGGFGRAAAFVFAVVPAPGPAPCAPCTGVAQFTLPAMLLILWAMRRETVRERPVSRTKRSTTALSLFTPLL